MIVYVNGDSHTAAAEAVTPHAFAEDDPFYYGLGRKPHPDNLRASYGCVLANELYAILECDAESASSNTRILRTTNQWLDHNRDPDVLVIIQWSTWERQEWLLDGQLYQVTASGTDDVPEAYAQRYKEFVSTVDWGQCRDQAHDQIWQLHQRLKSSNIAHVFFNGNNHFEGMLDQRNWGANYINPYDSQGTYAAILGNNNFEPVCQGSWHFGAQAHEFWANYLLRHLRSHQIIPG